MSKLTAPLLSFGGRGAVAKSVVYSSWKGIPYARQYTVPANPRTNKQTTVRSLFKWLNTAWLYLPPDAKAPWDANAVGRRYTGINKFIGFNTSGVDTVTPPTDLEDFKGSPGANGGLPPVSLTLTPGNDLMGATLVAPAIPDGWTISEAVFMAFPDQDPGAPFSGSIAALTDNAAPFTVSFTGLLSAQKYIVSAWFVWEKPDGKLAYSTSLTDSDVTT